jgi:hypothetical protein
MRDAAFIADAKGAVVYFNKAYASFHKFKSMEECSAKEGLLYAVAGVIPQHESPLRL